MSRYDVVVYGATGFTGAYIVGRLAKDDICQGVNFAVAGRNEQKIKKTLSVVSKKTGKDLSNVPIIIADNTNEESINNMAKQAKLIINAVGPYRLYGEMVVKAAVENGAHHLDISGEPAFLEQMAAKYGEMAREKGIYIVGACGWDSIPCDLGSHFLKKNFNGDLNHIESFVQFDNGPAGYCINTGTYQTLILGIANVMTDKLGQIRKQLMPQRIQKPAIKPPNRGKMWRIEEPELDGWALPFMGSDKSIVNRSQYYDATVRGARPAHIETYLRMPSALLGVLLALWLTVFTIFAQFAPTRKILQNYPDLCSFGMFKSSGPSEEQIKQAKFIYWLFGYGYDSKKPAGEQHEGKPNRKVVVTCRGPDAGYVGTSACIVASAMTVLKDRDNMPKEGGAYTTAAAFGDSKIFDNLASLGVHFKVEAEKKI